jgi:hypothetical protein
LRPMKSALTLGASLLLAATVQAQTTGTVTLNSEAGDSIGMGQFYAYDDTTASLSTSSDGSLLAVSAIQRISRTQTVSSSAYLQVHCTAPGTSVQIPVNPPSGGSFVKGRPMEISANLNTYDPAYNTWVSKTATEVVKLK